MNRISERCSLVKPGQKGAANILALSMRHALPLRPFRKPSAVWPAGQSVQSGDVAPDLRSVDEGDPPGRLPTPGELAAVAKGRGARLRPKKIKKEN